MCDKAIRNVGPGQSLITAITNTTIMAINQIPGQRVKNGLMMVGVDDIGITCRIHINILPIDSSIGAGPQTASSCDKPVSIRWRDLYSIGKPSLADILIGWVVTQVIHCRHHL